jgi:hypothetical protein
MGLTAIDIESGAVILPLDEGRTRGRCRDDACGGEMIAVREVSDYRRSHWRHKTLRDGTGACTRADSNKTPWHADWQMRCQDPERIEYRQVNGGRVRICDVMSKFGWAVEFQHSAIKRETVAARENHYKGRVIWVVNAATSYAISGAVDHYKGQLRWTQMPFWVLESGTLVAVDDGKHVNLLPPTGLGKHVSASELLIDEARIRSLTHSEFTETWLNGTDFPLPIEPATEWSLRQAERHKTKREADVRLLAASKRKEVEESDECTYEGNRLKSYPPGQRTKSVVIGSRGPYVIAMCAIPDCISAAGDSGWCWSHQPTLIKEGTT